MNTINSGPIQSSQTISPYAPLGKPAVGLESSENKDQTLPPVEETNAAEKNRNQPNQKTEAAADDSKRGNGGRDDQKAERNEQEDSQDAEAVIDHDAHQQVGALAATASFRFVAGLDGAPPHDDEKTNERIDAINAVDSFNKAAGQVLPPGSLLDQHS